MSVTGNSQTDTEWQLGEFWVYCHIYKMKQYFGF